MESSDYEGVHKYKWIAICLIVTSAFLSLFGPILLPVVTEYYHFMWVLFAFNKFITSTISLACSAIMQIIVTKRLENPRLIDEEKLALADSRSLLFAFVIPSYKEEESLLCETIQVLADHPQAKDRYLVFLAMEGHEQGSDAKAASIISKFKTSFKLITFSLHQLRPH